MDSAWIGALAALAGVLVGGLADAFRTRSAFRREKSWTAWEESRRRLEAIYQALEEVREVYGSAIGHTIFAMRSGERTARPTGTKVPWARLRMLVHLYAPSLLPELAKVERAGPELGVAMVEAQMRQSGDPVRDEPHLQRALIANDEFDAAANVMRDAIVQASGELDSKTRTLLGH